MRNSIWRTLFALVILAAAAPAASAQSYVVVVASSSPVSTLSRTNLSQVFLKRGTVNGRTLVPVDQNRSSPLRAVFTRVVHGRSIPAVVAYWQQQIFSGGSTPPSEKATDAEVLNFVRSTPNAIGYVTAGTALGSGVKAVTIL